MRPVNWHDKRAGLESARAVPEFKLVVFAGHVIADADEFIELQSPEAFGIISRRRAVVSTTGRRIF